MIINFCVSFLNNCHLSFVIDRPATNYGKNYHLVFVAYGSVTTRLRLVLCVEMVVNNLGFCYPYNSCQFCHGCLAYLLDRFKAV